MSKNTSHSRQQMDQNYWDRSAKNYESEFFDVLSYDHKGLVIQAIKRFGNPKHTASDFGCGVGRFLPSLAGNFGNILAVDLSKRCLQRAKKNLEFFNNIEFFAQDLASSQARIPRVHFALSVNALVTPSLKQRSSMFRLLGRHLKKAGHLVLVVPSLESALFTRARLIEWNLQEGLSTRAATRVGFSPSRQLDNTRLDEGLVPIDRVLTKHYLREELITLLQSQYLEVLEFQKIEYLWDTEFTKPPTWMKAPFPWDWLCIAKKV